MKPETQPLSHATPAVTPAAPVHPDDRYQVRVLAACYWLWGALMTFSGIMVFFAAEARIGAAVMILLGILDGVAGLSLYTRRHLWFILCVTALTIPLFPIGTILGISTVVVLRKAGVAALFASRQCPDHPVS